MSRDGRRPSALVLGAVTRDLEPGGAFRPGGVVVHAGHALARLGVRTRIVTRVATGDAAVLLAPLHTEGVEVRALPSRATTTYRNDYSGPTDRHELRGTSDPIAPDDIPADWRHADVVQLGPLHPHDLTPATAAVVRGFRGLDVQGLVRVPGTAMLRAAAVLPEFLPHADVVQASEQELAAMLAGDTIERFLARYGVGELIVTRGARGATIVTAGRRLDVRAAPATGTARVGAGDAFLATYLLARAQGEPPAAAGGAAARVSALKVAHGDLPPGEVARIIRSRT